MPSCYSKVAASPDVIQCNALKKLFHYAGTKTNDIHLVKKIHKKQVAPILDKLVLDNGFDALAADSLAMWTSEKGFARL